MRPEPRRPQPAASLLPLAWTLVPPGVLAWLALVQLGHRAEVRRWQRAGVLYGAATGIGLWRAEQGELAQGMAVCLLVWLVATVHALGVSGRYRRRLAELHDPELEAAEGRLRQRERAARLARRDPQKARALGVGRPDLEDAYHGGLVDVNGAPSQVLRGLPGFDHELAERTLRLREELGGFSSVEELGALAELSGPQVEALRDRIVFL